MAKEAAANRALDVGAFVKMSIGAGADGQARREQHSVSLNNNGGGGAAEERRGGIAPAEAA